MHTYALLLLIFQVKTFHLNKDEVVNENYEDILFDHSYNYLID